MAYSIQFKDGDGDVDGPFALATCQGWADLVAWAATSSSFKELAKNGSVEDTSKLAAELRALLKDRPPPPSVGRTVETLLSIVGTGDELEVAAVIGD